MDGSDWSVPSQMWVNIFCAECPQCPLPTSADALKSLLTDIQKCPHLAGDNGISPSTDSSSCAETIITPDVQSYIDIWIRNIVESSRRAFKSKSSKSPGNKINKYASRLMRKKSKLSNRLLRSKCPIAIDKIRKDLTQVERDLKSSLDRMLKSKEEQILPSIKKDPAVFYSYARSFSSTKTDIGPLLNKEEILVNDHKDMADILAAQYSAMFSLPNFKSNKRGCG